MIKLNKLKYRHKIAAIIFAFTLFPMIILGSFLIGKVWNGKVDNILAENKTQLINSVNGIDNMLFSSINKIYYINNNYYINNFLETDYDDNLVGIMSFNDYLQSVVMAIKADNPNADVIIYDLSNTTYDGDYIRSIESFGNDTENPENLKKEIFENDENGIVWRFNTQKVNDGTNELRDYICVYKKIESMKKPIAITEIRIPITQITDYFQNDIPRGSFIVCNMENGKKKYVVNSGTLDMKSALYSAETYFTKGVLKDYIPINLDLKSGMGTIIMFIPKNLIFKELSFYLITIFIAFVIITVILFFTVEFVAYFLTKKLQNLFLKMNMNIESMINNENLEIHVEEDEFGTIENKFHELIQKIKEYYKEKNEYEFERKSLETKLLQERINPHFLYNTLSTMKWISEDKRVQNVIDSMVKYYRIALNKGSSIITIYQEMEMIGEYLKLQNFAYGNEFESKIDIEEGLGKHLILKHLLQPIVENAVLHGLNGCETGGLIIIKVLSQEDKIVFEITDNGIGMEQDKIERLLNGETDMKYGGYGMKNIQKRMEVFYGKDGSIDIKSEKNQGTTVRIIIPGMLESDIHNSMK